MFTLCTAGKICNSGQDIMEPKWLPPVLNLLSLVKVKLISYTFLSSAKKCMSSLSRKCFLFEKASLILAQL